MILRCEAPDASRAVVVEDDGRAAYAYLLDGDDVVGDVWLYNVGGDPLAVDWADRSAMPFQNPAAYCAGLVVDRIAHDTVLSCEWSADGVALSIGGVSWAHLRRGSKPGWSRNARAPGPLALPLATSRSGEQP